MSEANTSSVVDVLRRQNAGREPERLAMKYAKMKESPFVFLRGACGLFYDALPDHPVLTRAPLAWCCGDLHFENFGSYKADNRLVYFDINDYDEAALAPCTWDIVRLLTSFRCGADALGATAAEALAVSHDCLAAYRDALLDGKPLWVERETSTGPIHKLLVSLQDRNRADFLDLRTTRKGKRRQLKVDGIKALPVDDAQRAKVAAFMEGFAAAQPEPGFFQMLDVARRIAGTGSLGVARYVILVEGKDSPDGNHLLDLKEAKPSSLLPRLGRLGIVPPTYPDEATRIVSAQERLQAARHAFLSPVVFDNLPGVLKELQPVEDRVAIADWGRKLDRLREVVTTMGRILAWDQLRASGRAGSACADDLIDFARDGTWVPAIFETVDFMTKTTRLQWQAFCAAKL
jgi:uncharacterized protein (DUF2252 family)